VSKLTREAVIGFLVSLSADERSKLDAEVFKIIASQKVSDERMKTRELLLAHEAAFRAAGTNVLGLAIGGADGRTRGYVRAVWPGLRAKHLLVPRLGGLSSACGKTWTSLSCLGELEFDLSLGEGSNCTACMEARPRKKGRGFWGYQPPHYYKGALTAVELGLVI
jgi:hypothetical protein